jgi:long-chain acyl-CoA synthetase
MAMIPTFDENNLAGIGLNRARGVWNEPKLISKYKHGRHGAEWQSYTMAEAYDLIFALATAWERRGLQPGDRVAVMGANRPRWIFSMQSLLAARLVTVTIYPTLTAAEAAFNLRDSGARFIVVDTLAQAAKIQSVFDSLPDLEGIVIMDAVDETLDAPLMSFDSLVESAREHVDEEDRCDVIRAITPDDPAAIIYTSGTTGTPKGVVLTHGNFLSQRPLQACFDLDEKDIFLNHLPFCHSFGLTADMFGSAYLQATLVIADGIEPEKIRHALHTIRPTVLMSVPRLFEKIYVQVQQVVAAKPPFVQKLIAGSLAVGKRAFDLKTAGKPIPLGLAIKHRLARRITKKVLAQAGLDRVHLTYAGGAPMSSEMAHFYQGLGVELLQGYGLTETSPVTNVNLPGKNKLGTVGPPLEGVEVKLAEDGEVLVRGACVMQGYYKNPQATAEVIDPDGWFHTGDIGRMDEDGYLSIIDRKKELIVTSGGKNIAPLLLESAFNTERYIERVVVIGDEHNYLTALVCPDFDHLRPWMKEQGHPCETNAEIAAHPAVRTLLEERVAEINKQFARFEQIKKIAILPTNFTVHTGEITPTEKLKRRFIAEKFAEEIAALYKS